MDANALKEKIQSLNPSLHGALIQALDQVLADLKQSCAEKTLEPHQCPSPVSLNETETAGSSDSGGMSSRGGFPAANLEGPEKPNPRDIEWYWEAKIYPSPASDSEEMAAMRASVKARGLVEPIRWCRIPKTGKCFKIDGRFKERACLLEGVEPTYEEVELPDEKAIHEFILDRNVHRKHWRISQRAMLGAKIMPLFTEAAEKRRLAGRKIDLSENLSEGEVGSVREIVAGILNVSSGAVAQAARVLNHGAPELIQQVESGAISVSAADNMLELLPEEQKKAAKSKKTAKAAAAKVRKDKKAKIAT